MVGFADDWDPNATWTPNTEITYTGDEGLINAPSATSGDVTLQNIVANTSDSAPSNTNSYTPEIQIAPPSSVNDAPKPEAIAGAEKSQTAGGASKSFFDTIGDSFSKTMQKHGGEIFANTLSGAAQGVLAYLLQRRRERADIDLENRRNQNKINETNATVARASAMPRIGSMIKSPQPSQSAGLINARRA